MWTCWSAAAGMVATVSISGPSARIGATRAAPLGLRAEIEGLDAHERAAAKRLGDVGDRRELEQPADGGHVVGHVGGPLAPGVQDLARALDREEHDAGVDLGEREEHELDRRHGTEASAAAADRPEQVRVGLGIDPADGAVGRHDLDRDDVRRGQTVAAAEPAEPSAERVPDDADVRRGAGQRRKPVRPGGLGDLGPDHSGLDARGAVHGVDLDAAHPLHLHEDRAGELAAPRGRAVARPLHRDAQVALGGVGHHGRHVCGRLGERDHRRALVNRQVPGETRSVPVGVVRKDDVAVDLRAESRRVKRRCRSRKG